MGEGEEEGHDVNTGQLKNNVGQLLRLRPYPRFVDGVDEMAADLGLLTSDGPRRVKRGQDADYDWRLAEAIAKDVTLVCSLTGHKVTLGNDNVKEYRSPNFLILKCQLIVEGRDVRIEPTW